MHVQLTRIPRPLPPQVTASCRVHVVPHRLLDCVWLCRREEALTDPLEVSTDHPICRPSPPKVSRNRNQLLFVSSVCCSPIQSSSSSGDMTSLSSGSTSDDMRVGMMVGEVSCMNSTCGRPSVSGRPPINVSRPKDTSFGRGRGRVAVSILGGGEARGEDEGESPPSGREDDMLAVLAVAWRVLKLAFALCATWAALEP
jgi:hypothetical protein